MNYKAVKFLVAILITVVISVAIILNIGKSQATLNAPTFKVDRVYNTSVSLSWSRVNRADGYQVKMYNSDTGKTYYRYYGKNTTQTIRDNMISGKHYKFSIRAYNLVNNKKVYGQTSQVRIVRTHIGTPPTNLRVLGTELNSISLSWAKVKNITNYEIHFCNTKQKKNSIMLLTLVIIPLTILKQDCQKE